MVNILQGIFKGSPKKAEVDLSDTCSDCKNEVVIKITPTTEGFGLQGGALFKNSKGGYYAKCPHCYEANRKIFD